MATHDATQDGAVSAFGADDVADVAGEMTRSGWGLLLTAWVQHSPEKLG